MYKYQRLLTLAFRSNYRLSKVRKFSEHLELSKLQKNIPRRCLLYVPGNDEKKIKKAKSVCADCVVLDCEDGVAVNQKINARSTIRKALENETFGRSECAVRINSVDSGLAEDDLQEILQSSVWPSTILLPKVTENDQLTWLADRIAAFQNPQHVSKFNLIFYVESAIGLLRLASLCQHAVNLNDHTPIKFEGIVFGSDDFCADIGAERSSDARELMYARQHVIVVAKAFRVQAIDVVYIDYKDLDGLQKQSLEGAHLGFTGKQVIHPAQVPVVQKAYSPSREKIDWAVDLIKAFVYHQNKGKGAFIYKGQMIDKPLLLQAKNIVELASAVDQDEG